MSIFPPVAVLHRPVEQYLYAVRMLVPVVRAATLCCAPARLLPVLADLCLYRQGPQQPGALVPSLSVAAQVMSVVPMSSQWRGLAKWVALSM